MDPLDRELADAVNVDPSPEFVARVRARVATERVSARPRLWPVVAAAALAATVAIAFYVQRLDRHALDGLGAVAIVPPAISAPAPASVKSVERHTMVGARRRTRSAPRVPEVIVASDELRGWRQLANLVRSGDVELRFDDKQKPVIESLSLKEIVVKPIDIEPLAVASNPEQGDEQ